MFVEDFNNNKEIKNLIYDDELAREIYSAMCNTEWVKEIAYESYGDKILGALQDNLNRVFGCSWRYAAGLVASARNRYYNKGEDYLDFYCTGNEGHVTDRVNDIFNKMGWTLVQKE